MKEELEGVISNKIIDYVCKLFTQYKVNRNDGIDIMINTTSAMIGTVAVLSYGIDTHEEEHAFILNIYEQVVEYFKNNEYENFNSEKQ